MELYKLEEINQHKYYKVPKDLFEIPCYRYALTSDAKLVYAALLDRMELSRKNKWVNDQGEIYLLYAKENLAEILGVAERTVYNAFKLLEACSLIKQERQGLNKPNKIYIGKVDYSFSIALNPRLSRICKICRSGCANIAGQDMQNMQGNETELNETEMSETESTYITLASDELFLDFYLKTHKKYLGKNHVRVTHEQKKYIERSIKELISTGIDYDMWQEAVLEHFQKLPKKNNGNILAFLKASFRYFEVELNTA
jgi:predicted transcriptional regulator